MLKEKDQKCSELQPAKVLVVKAKINARKHLKQVKYLIERYVVVQQHYHQQETLITADIYKSLERKQSLKRKVVHQDTAELREGRAAKKS